jgi:acyl-ACP thioesterase
MKTLREQYQLNSYLISPQGKPSLYHLLNLLQETSSAHAQNIGIGRQAMLERNLFWVIVRQKLVMYQWPKWNDQIEIETWIRKGNHTTTNRDFKIYLGDHLIGEATSNWLSLDVTTRKPIIWNVSALLEENQHQDQVKIDTHKIFAKKDCELISLYQVRNSDIDQNQHVNNTKYAQWILDAIDIQDQFKYRIESYAVNFIAECKLGDDIEIQRSELSPELIHFQGVRHSDQKVVFTAELGIKN